MRPRPSRAPAGALAAALALALASLPALADAEEDAAPRAASEERAKPGLNETFLDEDLDVEHYVEVFESESREVAAARDAIVEALGLAPGMEVADVGAGTGLFLAPFARAVGESGRVYAVEIAPRFLDHLRERVREEGLANVTVVEAEARDSNLPPDSVDLVFLCDTYHHVEHPDPTLASLRRALRPGGELVVVDFERVPGESSDWVLEHVRAGRDVFAKEIEAAGFTLVGEIPIEALEENYALRFRRPTAEGPPAEGLPAVGSPPSDVR